MANTIKIKRSTTTATPTSLSEGELAYSENSKNLFIGTSGGNISNIGGKIGVTVQAYDANIVSDATYQSTENDFTDTLKTKLDGVAQSANNYSLPSSVVHETEKGALHATDALSISGHTITLKKGDNTTETVTVPDNNTTYSVGDGELTQKNFTTTLKTKLDGIETGSQVNVGTNLGDTVHTIGGVDYRAITSTTGTNVLVLNASATIPGMMSKEYAGKVDSIETDADVTDTANVVASLTAGTNVAISAGGTISSTYTDTTYSVGDGGLTQNNFTDALKSNYDASYNWYTTMTTSDADSVIDTVNEVISAFQNHAEGLNLISELDSKLTASSTIDGGTF